MARSALLNSLSLGGLLLLLALAGPVGCDSSDAPAGGPGAVAPPAPPPIPEEPGPGPMEIVAPRGAVGTGDPGGPANIEFNSLTHDFKRVRDGLTYRTSFRFRNTGTGTLRIAAVKSNCSCTSPRLETFEYAPGASGEIGIVYDPRGKLGRSPSQVTVISNATSGPATLRIVATVQPLIWFQRIIQVGTIPLGDLHHTETDFYAGEQTLEVLRIATTHPSITAKLLESAVHDPAKAPEDSPYRWRMVISVGPGAPWGVLVNERVDVTVRARPAPGSEPVVRTYAFHLRGTIVGQLRVDPETAHLGVLRGDEPIEKRIVVYHATAQAFDVTNATMADTSVPGLRAITTRETDDRWTITISGRSGTYRGPIQGSLVVETNVEGEERIELRFTGYVR